VNNDTVEQLRRLIEQQKERLEALEYGSQNWYRMSDFINGLECGLECVLNEYKKSDVEVF